MDLTETMLDSEGTDDSEPGATDTVPTLPMPPMLPTLPPPVLPASTSGDVVVLPSMLLPRSRPNPAANAAYGAIPVKPRAGEPSPATVRAAEIRHRAKKRRRIKRLAVLAVLIVIGVFAGPPTARWIADGLDQAGSTETETPPSD